MTIKTKEEKVKKKNYADLKGLFDSQEHLLFDQFLVSTLEGLMRLDRKSYLESEEGKDDSANGSYLRNFKSLGISSLGKSIPSSSSNGQFQPTLLELMHAQKEKMTNLSLLLYRKGISVKNVAEVMKYFFGEQVTWKMDSNLAASFHEIRKKWQETTLDAYYKAVYCVTLDDVNVQTENGGSKVPFCIMYGVKDNYTRELLLLELATRDGINNWGKYLEKLWKKGVEQIDLVVADDISDLENEVKKYFPESRFQKCVVDLQRNLLSKVNSKDKSLFSSDLKEVFDNFDSESTKGKALNKLNLFVKKWSNLGYANLVDQLLNKGYRDHYFTYIAFPIEVRSVISTTNLVRSLNDEIYKVVKKSASLEEESLKDLIFMTIKNCEAHDWQISPVNDFQYLF